MQEKGYYCGPACVYMTVEGIKYHTPSAVNSSFLNTQEKHANAMGTTENDGTSEAAIRKRLSDILVGRRYAMDYKYVLDEKGNVKLDAKGNPIINFKEQEFIDYIKNSLAKNGPVIVLINEPFLSYYPSSYPYTSRHYVVVSECIESNSGDTVTFTIDDPNHWNNGTLCAKHVVSASNLYSCFAALEWIVYN